ncbi:hypothetical protein pb186bvf_002600 [Paramecium bursaria]
MGIKLSREYREKIEQFNEDKEKRDLEIKVNTQIEVYNKAIHLSRFQHLDNLLIELEGDQIIDISAFKDANLSTGLRTLRIFAKQQKISDIDILPPSPELIQINLQIGSTLVSSIQKLAMQLSNCTLMETLQIDASRTQIDSIKDLQLNKMLKLKSLNLNFSHTKLKGIDTFSENIPSSCLETLILNFNYTDIEDLAILGSNLRNMTKLKLLSLKFSNTKIEGILDICSGISYMVNLNSLTLEIENTVIDDIEPLAQALKIIQNLEFLSVKVNGTKITSIKELCDQIGYKTSLISLTLGLQVQNLNLEPLKKALDVQQRIDFLKLETLNLKDSKLLNIIVQQEFLNSLCLNFYQSELDTLDSFFIELAGLKKLRHLQLLFNDSKLQNFSLGILASLNQLRTLQIEIQGSEFENFSSFIQDIQNIKQLQELILNLKGSKIPNSQIEELKESIKSLKHLKQIQIQH